MFVCIKKRTIIIAVAILLVVAIAITIIACAINPETTATMAGAKRKLPVYSVARQDKVIALTFDAAWGADKTKGIIDIMNEHDAKGTFFLVGFWIDKFESEVKMIADNGFEIGNHSRNHLKMSTLSNEDIVKELAYVNEHVERLTSKQCKVFRPPFGDYNDKLIDGVKSLQMTPIQWDVDTLDWKGVSGDEIVTRVMSKAKNGSIVLFHNNSDHVLDALPTVLTKLKAEGYTFLTVSEMLHKDNYTIDNNGVQRQN